MTVKRNRRKQTLSFDERLRLAAREARQSAQKLPQGPERETLLKKARQAETAMRINGWLALRGPHPDDDCTGSPGSLLRSGSRLPGEGGSRSSQP